MRSHTVLDGSHVLQPHMPALPSSPTTPLGCVSPGPSRRYLDLQCVASHGSFCQHLSHARRVRSSRTVAGYVHNQHAIAGSERLLSGMLLGIRLRAVQGLHGFSLTLWISNEEQLAPIANTQSRQGHRGCAPSLAGYILQQLSSPALTSAGCMVGMAKRQC